MSQDAGLQRQCRFVKVAHGKRKRIAFDRPILLRELHFTYRPVKTGGRKILVDLDFHIESCACEK